MREEERIENLLQAAISSLQVGDASTTGDACGAILELDHAHPEAHFILGLSFFKCGNVESARQYLIAGLDSHSPNSVVLAPVIRALDALGETESTLRACNSYLEQHPADVETLLIRARQWSLQKHVGQAISDCETALALSLIHI